MTSCVPGYKRDALMTNPAFILVIDTDPGLRRLLDLILTRGGYLVLSADSSWRLAMREIEADADILKPFSPEELLVSVAGLLAEKEPTGQRTGFPAGFVSPAQSRPRLIADPYTP